MRKSLDNLKQDIAQINGRVSATMSYAILERAGMTLRLGAHDFMRLIPALAEHVRRDARPEISVATDVAADADRVVCDRHRVETALRNLRYDAVGFARHEVRVRFALQDGMHCLFVDDDGPGVPDADRERVFGLGLAIVKRAIESHAGEVSITNSPLGGARLAAVWPILRAPAP